MRVAKGLENPQSTQNSSGPSKDFSLKDGEKITVNIPGITGKKPAEKPLNSGFGGGLKKLAPPPGKS